MADGGLHTKPQQRVPSSSSSSNNTQNNKKNPSKFYTHFMFKAIIVAISLVIIPLFPSEAPDIVTPSFFSRWWELVHLIFVGIAVSYGLFSRKNHDDDDLQGDNTTTSNSKFDTAHSYVSKLLQVPPVFDDYDDDVVDCDDHNIRKIQTWNSQYYRNKPVVVVANKDSSNLNDNNSHDNDKNSGVVEKPLLLPVRSLKSRVSEEKDAGVSRVYARSNSSHSLNEFGNDSRRISRNDVKLGNEEDSGVNRGYVRSSSGVSARGFVSESRRMRRNDSVKSRTGVRNDSGVVNGDGEVSRSLSKSNSNLSSRGFSSHSRRRSSGDYGSLDDKQSEEREEKVEESVVLPSPIPWRSRSGSMEMNRESFDSSPHSLPASLEESGAVHLVRSQSSLSCRSNSSSLSSSPKELSPSPTVTSPKRLSPSPSLSSESLGKSVEDFGRRKLAYGSQLPPPPPPPPPPFNKSKMVKSSSSNDNQGSSIQRKDLKRSVRSEPKDAGRGNREESLLRTKTGLEAKARNSIDNSSAGKSVRTVRAGEMTPTRKTREMQDEGRTSEDIVSGVNENPERKTAGYNPMSRASFSEFPKETRDFLEQVMVGTDDESESEDENYVEEPVEAPKAEETHPDSVDEGPDVDKKADEFIAKFREQIRLQRIESIKRSTGQLKRSAVR